jgi:hypothetical protein
MADGHAQRQEYGSKTGIEGDDKLQSTSTPPMIKGGGSGDGSGPTGSSRSYPKGSKLSLTADFNPMKVPATDYGVGGV